MNALHVLDDSPWFEWIQLQTTDSTNNFLKGYKPFAPKDMTLVSVDYQTAGRGQANNKWEAECGRNLLFGIKIFPDFLFANRQFVISQISALAAKEALEDYADGFTVKWPNDIYWGDKKIGGMLIENTVCGKHLESSVIGIGLNINQQKFVSDAPNPVSLFHIIGKETERVFILARVVERFKFYYGLLRQSQTDAIASAYEKALYRGHGFYPYEDAAGSFMARVSRIEPTGHLLLEDTGGVIRKYAFKEVRCVIPTTDQHQFLL